MASKSSSELEFRVREVERELSLVVSERDRGAVSVASYSKSLSERDSSILSLEREIAALKSKTEGLSQQIMDKDEVIVYWTLSIVWNMLS